MAQQITAAHVAVALEGAEATALSLMAFTEDENDRVHQGLIGVVNAIHNAALLLEQAAATEELDPEAPCKHPQDRQRDIPAGRTILTMCDACNEIIRKRAA